MPGLQQRPGAARLGGHATCTRAKDLWRPRCSHPWAAVQEKALTSNAIIFAKPTADAPSMELPPPTDALVDSLLNVIFTRSLHDMSKAEWASVDREQYMRIIEERKQQCPAFSNVQVRHDLAATRLARGSARTHLCVRARGRRL